MISSAISENIRSENTDQNFLVMTWKTLENPTNLKNIL